MKNQLSLTRKSFGILLIAALVANFFLLGASPVQAQKRKPIIITSDQPNIWTLEQAHYLLEQRHRRNLDLKTKHLEDLDPNEITGLRIDVLKTLLEVGVNYDDANRVTNNLLAGSKKFNVERRQTLLSRRDQLRAESLSLTRDISNLQSDRARATDPAEQARLDAAIKRKTDLRERVDKESEFTDGELKTLTDPSGEFKPTTANVAFDPAKLPSGLLDDAFKNAAKELIESSTKAPKLNASLMLSNFLQMQDEIISKQLTLLRDEVGPGERLLFLELPQSLNVVYDKANKKWAQSWWKILGYTKPKRNGPPRNGGDPNSQANPPRTTSEIYDSILNPLSLSLDDFTDIDSVIKKLRKERDLVSKYLSGKFEAGTKTLLNEYEDGPPSYELLEALTSELNKLIKDPTLYTAIGKLVGNASPETIQLQNKIKDDSSSDDKIRLNLLLLADAYSKEMTLPEYVDLDAMKGSLRPIQGIDAAKISVRKVRTIDLIPRQSSLNVQDVKLQTHAGALTAVASFLFGFGAKVNYQRQREQFSQFVQQELYSSGFGKGSREFGWTFMPMPGADRLLSGLRTTYAVMIVPDDATTILLESTGCYFPRSAYQPNDFADTEGWGKLDEETRNCSDHQSFLIPIPGGGNDRNNDFYITGLTYNSVDKEGRVVLSIYGRNFSSQIGVLVDGVPLIPAVGLAQPLIRDDSEAGKAAAKELEDRKEIVGKFERIDANQILAAFERADGKEGTPVITLVAPGKAKDLNKLMLYINGRRDSKLEDADWMFGKRPTSKPLGIERVDIFRSVIRGNLTAMISGARFTDPTEAAPISQKIYINGTTHHQQFLSSKLLRVDLPVTSDEAIQVTLIAAGVDAQGNQVENTIKAQPVTNPAQLRISNVTLVSYEAGRKASPAVLVVKIEGSGFSSDLASNVGVLIVQSPNVAFLKIANPGAAVVVSLTDNRTGAQVSTLVTRRQPPK